MTLYVYTGTLTDIGLGPLTGRSPVMRVRPEREVFGPNGLISAVPQEVSLNSSTGEFAITLHASEFLSPQVDYVIEVGRFEQGFDGARFVGVDVWRFRALAGGGPIAGEPGTPYPVFIGPPVAPWPSEGTPGLYMQAVAPNEWGIVPVGS